MDYENTLPLRYTRIELKNPETGGKHYYWDENGKLVKDTVGWIVSARAFVELATNLADFATVLNTKLSAGRDVLAYGIPKVEVPEDGVPLVTKDNLSDGTIARSEDHFTWPEGPAIFAADYDPRPDHAALTRDELWQQVVTVAPKYAEYDVLWGCSSSSFIYDEMTDDVVVGLKGQRLYMGVEDGTDIPRAAEVMLKRMWLHGFGYILISGSGAQLIRTTLDPCMYQASRLDYAAGAVCGEGLEQRRPDAFLINEGLAIADTRRVFPNLTHAEERRYQALIAQARRQTLDAAVAQREVWADERLEDEARTALGKSTSLGDIALHVKEATRNGRRAQLMRMLDTDRPVLHADHVLHLSKGKLVTVGDVLRSPSAFEGKTTCDPLEPDYRGGATTGKIYAHNRRLVSHAHGITRTYVLGSASEAANIRAECAANLSSLIAPKAKDNGNE
ncbi:hypothetical protein [Ruegeria sp. HKCCA6837]|uniref:hypothetical protein n=1 Tax=Ruegeria sp. HKCCA6837 TaxID=2682989 RepID=UPI0014885BA5|nr:hypothetical protein [Ruegeria sp. HKCCA6837]